MFRDLVENPGTVAKIIGLLDVNRQLVYACDPHKVFYRGPHGGWGSLHLSRLSEGSALLIKMKRFGIETMKLENSSSYKNAVIYISILN